MRLEQPRNEGVIEGSGILKHFFFHSTQITEKHDLANTNLCILI